MAQLCSSCLGGQGGQGGVELGIQLKISIAGAQVYIGQKTIRFSLVHLEKCSMDKCLSDICRMIFILSVKSMFQVSDL